MSVMMALTTDSPGVVPKIDTETGDLLGQSDGSSTSGPTCRYRRMNVIHTLIAIGIAGGGYTYWKDHKRPDQVVAAVADGRPFESLPSVEGHHSHTVFVVAAENCPHADAKRADRLAESLAGQGIPVERTHSAHFRFSEMPSSSTIDRMNRIMTGSLPLVFVNGRAKNNPSVGEVVAEFNANRP